MKTPQELEAERVADLRKNADQRRADQRTADQRTSDQRTTDQKTTDARDHRNAVADDRDSRVDSQGNRIDNNVARGAPNVVDARKRDVNAPNAPDWSPKAKNVDPKDEPLHEEGDAMSFQDTLDISAAQGKPVTGPADAAHPDAELDVPNPEMSDADRGAAMREQKPLPKLGE